MENTKRDFREHGPHGRFFRWAKEKMTGKDAFGIFYGEKGEDYPAEMREDFISLFDESKEAMNRIHCDREAYMEKWKEYTPDHDVFSDMKGHRPPFGFGGNGHAGHEESYGKERRFFGW